MPRKTKAPSPKPRSFRPDHRPTITFYPEGSAEGACNGLAHLPWGLVKVPGMPESRWKTLANLIITYMGDHRGEGHQLSDADLLTIAQLQLPK